MTIPKFFSRFAKELTWKKIFKVLWITFMLGLAMLFSFFSTVASWQGNLWATIVFTFLSLLLAGVIAWKVVPNLYHQVYFNWRTISFSITRRGWIYLLSVLITGLAAFNTNNNLLFLVFSIALSLLIISGMFSHLNLRSLEIYLNLPENVEAGKMFSSLLQIQNNKWVIPSLSLALAYPAAKLNQSNDVFLPSEVENNMLVQCFPYFYYLPGKLKSQCYIPLFFPKRGLYSEHKIEIASEFPFGFVRRKISYLVEQELIVLPKVEPIDSVIKSLALREGTWESAYRGEGFDLYSIRDYYSSDSARFIDWKSSAKTGKLKLREFTREEDRRYSLVFDNYYEGFDEINNRFNFEKAVSICANTARYLQEMGNEIRLITTEVVTSFSKSEEGLMEILKALASIEPNLKQCLPKIAWQKDVAFTILFTSQPHEGLLAEGVTGLHVVLIQNL